MIDELSDQEVSDLLQRTRTIALVGASNKPSRPSFQVMQYLLGQNYRVIPVNPGLEGQRILEQNVFAQLSDIEEPVHMVDIFRNSAAAYAVVEEAVRLKADSVWMQEGVINDSAAELAHNRGLKVVMDKCTKKEHARLLSKPSQSGEK